MDQALALVSIIYMVMVGIGLLLWILYTASTAIDVLSVGISGASDDQRRTPALVATIGQYCCWTGIIYTGVLAAGLPLLALASASMTELPASAQRELGTVLSAAPEAMALRIAAGFGLTLVGFFLCWIGGTPTGVTGESALTPGGSE
jgi:hypothetical protein